MRGRSLVARPFLFVLGELQAARYALPRASGATARCTACGGRYTGSDSLKALLAKGAPPTVVEAPRLVVCGDGGVDFGLSARNVRAARARGEEAALPVLPASAAAGDGRGPAVVAAEIQPRGDPADGRGDLAER